MRVERAIGERFAQTQPEVVVIVRNIEKESGIMGLFGGGLSFPAMNFSGAAGFQNASDSRIGLANGVSGNEDPSALASLDKTATLQGAASSIGSFAAGTADDAQRKAIQRNIQGSFNAFA